jgi:hypothetical protein
MARVNRGTGMEGETEGWLWVRCTRKGTLRVKLEIYGEEICEPCGLNRVAPVDPIVFDARMVYLRTGPWMGVRLRSSVFPSGTALVKRAHLATHHSSSAAFLRLRYLANCLSTLLEPLSFFAKGFIILMSSSSLHVGSSSSFSRSYCSLFEPRRAR